LRCAPAATARTESRQTPESAVAGRWGEDAAARWLREAGFKILGVRVRVDRRDELDIVARQGDEIVFVEVKTRRSTRFGRPVEAVKRGKRLVLSRAAVRYLKQQRLYRRCFRFDVVEVVGQPGDADPEIEHIPNAFPLDRRYTPP
jgi:putative endonuclease